jgi:glycosyltransferase involved in cell wall biosynthesis/tetratricopeptide (TPR) repeat protein
MSLDPTASVKDLEIEALGLAEREPERAAIIFGNILACEPNRLSTLRPLARLRMKQRRLEEARTYWERVALLAPKDEEARAALESMPALRAEAEAIALAAQDPAKAAEMLEAILAQEPNRLTALRPLARLLMRRARFEDARIYWERVTALAPNDGEPRMALGRVHARAGRVLEALDRLGQVLRINPANEDARRLRAKIAEKEIADLIERIGTANADQIASRVEALEPLLGGEVNFERLKTYCALLRAGDSDDESSALAFEDSSESESFDFLSRLNTIGDAPSTDELKEIERDSARVTAENPLLAKTLAQFHLRRGDSTSAFDVYRKLSAESDSAQLWLEAADLAVASNLRETVIEFCTRAVRAPDAGRAVLAEAATLLGEAGAQDAVVALLREAPGYESDLDARRRVVRTLFELARDRETIAEALKALEHHVPNGAMPQRQLPALVDIVRRLRKATWRARVADGVAACAAALRAQSDGSAIANWTLGMLASAELDMEAAAAHFEAARALGLPESLKMDLAAEIALLHERFQHYGEAYAAMRPVPPALLQGEYGALQRVRGVVEFCGIDAQLRFPECLIDIIFAEIAQDGAIGYEPRLGHLITVSSSLRAGGSERQTVTVAGRMARDPRIEKVVLALRQMNETDSFLHTARETPVEIVHFGADWNRRSDVLAALPRLQGRERLARAIDLLPHLHREELIRVTKLILERRPQAVHLRQDLFIAGIACRLAGVDNFVIHRGSLSPNLWGHGPLESELYLRPMRHTYRGLLAEPGFCIVNNSQAGMDSDRDWTGWSEGGPFRVIHNAIEFAKLDTGARTDPRAQAAIPHDAFLIAGIFRIEPVKRPMLWIETASLVAKSHPNAHFVILGDGQMRDEMHGFAVAAGFADRLHMPGFVSNVADWLRVIDLVLLTSEREGLPNVLIEGQHFGVPAVTADVGGAFETIESGVTGHLVPAAAGASEFAKFIDKAIVDEEWRKTARDRAPAFAHAKFGVERTIGELFACLGIDD